VHGDVDPRLLADLTRWCADRDVMPQGLTVGRRSLEDVFLELTGSELR
jgi:ABC-2 type transport system ATP-binding protein